MDRSGVTWPSRTVVGMERGTERVRLLLESRSPWESETKQPDLIPVGLEAWRIEVKSANAEALMREVRRGLRLKGLDGVSLSSQ